MTDKSACHATTGQGRPMKELALFTPRTLTEAVANGIVPYGAISQNEDVSPFGFLLSIGTCEAIDMAGEMLKGLMLKFQNTAISDAERDNLRKCLHRYFKSTIRYGVDKLYFKMAKTRICDDVFYPPNIYDCDLVYLACRGGNYAIVGDILKRLAQAKQDNKITSKIYHEMINGSVQRKYPLHEAIKNGKQWIVDLLLKHQVNILFTFDGNGEDSSENIVSALEVGASHWNPDGFAWLWEKLHDSPECKDRLHWVLANAISLDNDYMFKVDIVEFILKKKPELLNSIILRCGNPPRKLTPLMLAVNQKWLVGVMVLQDLGASFREPGNILRELTTLPTYSWNRLTENNFSEMVEIAHKVFMHAQDPCVFTAEDAMLLINYAFEVSCDKRRNWVVSEHNKLEFTDSKLRRLLGVVPDCIYMKNREFQEALLEFVACRYKSVSMLESLENWFYGDTEQMSKLWSTFVWSDDDNSLDVVNFLLSKGADPTLGLSALLERKPAYDSNGIGMSEKRTAYCPRTFNLFMECGAKLDKVVINDTYTILDKIYDNIPLGLGISEPPRMQYQELLNEWFRSGSQIVFAIEKR